MPTRQRHRAEDIQQRIHIDVAGWRQIAGTVPTLPTVQEAIWGERKLLISYQRAEDRDVERVIDPLGLVAKGSLWYLVAAHDGELRTYRVSRINEAEVLDEPCVRPADFDLAAFWAQSSREFITNLPQYRATVRAAPSTVQMIRLGGRYARIETEEPSDAEGWVRLQMLFETADGAREFVLGFGTAIIVESPAALREEVVCAAAGIVALYREQAMSKS